MCEKYKDLLHEQQANDDAYISEARATCAKLIPEYTTKMTNHATARDNC